MSKRTGKKPITITSAIRSVIPKRNFMAEDITDLLWSVEDFQHIPEPKFKREVAVRLIKLKTRREIMVVNRIPHPTGGGYKNVYKAL